MEFPYKKGDIEDREVFLIGDNITTSIWNQVYGAALLADRWTQKSTNMDFDPYINYFSKHNVKDLYKGESLTGIYATEVVSDEDGDNDTMYSDGATRVTSNSATSGVNIGGYTSSLSADFSEFPDGSASSDDDFIVFSFVVNDATKWNYGGLRIGTDSSNYYYKYPYATAMVNGVNHFAYQKSTFNTTGSPVDWSTIGYAAIRFVGADSVDTTGEWVTLQTIQLVRNNGDDDVSPRQLINGAGTLEEPYGTPLSFTTLRQAYNKPIGYSRLKSDASSEVVVFNDKLVNTFYAEMLQYIAYDSYSLGLALKIDTDNYIQCYVESDTFYLDVYEGGSLASQASQALTNGIKRFENLRLCLEKDSTTLRAQVIAPGEVLTLYGTTTLEDEGQVLANQPTANSLGVVTGYTVSNERKQVNIYPMLIQQLAYIDHTTLANTNLTTFLEPNGMYHIYMVHVLKGDVAGGAVLDWDFDGDVSQVTYRTCDGLGYGETDEDAATVRRTAHNLGTNVTYGLSTTNGNYKEDFVVKTGALGGRLTSRVGQAASETITINGVGSYMIVTKMNS